MRSSLKNFLLSTLSGILLSVAWPANGWPFFLFVALVPLFYIERTFNNQTKYKALKFIGLCYWAFFLWNLTTTWWIYNASPFGAYVAILLNSFIMALIFRLFQATKSNLGKIAGYASLVFYWIAFEYLHNDWDLSWPWLSLGNGFANYVKYIQWYSITGILGGTLWVLLSNIFIVNGLLQQPYTKRHIVKFTTIVLLWITLPIGVSFYQFYTYQPKSNKTIEAVLIQPNIDPWTEKFGGLTTMQQVNRILRLASAKTDSTTDFVICPETAIPTGVWIYKLAKSKPVNKMQAFVAAHPQLRIITGITLYSIIEPDKEQVPITASPYPGQDFYYDDHNSAIQIGQKDSFQIYHKSKLVPGPEKMPFAKVLKPLQKQLFNNLGGMIGDFGTQKERTVFYNAENAGVAAPVICYESIYGEFVGGYIKKGANFIAIITNDAWWGDTPGYRQLLAYARLRAIETRRSIARAANTGITCFIDQKGIIYRPTNFKETTSIKGKIQLNDTITFYTRYGDYLGRFALWLSALALLCIIIFRYFLKRK